ncbi:hypothetical protein [Aurantiacibacter sp. D1-12]|uniref:hypothetical protein n=1 Tax=Aurantiacibacter sp. D1-12 TaxID=2993658 RepID=UPI00237CD3BC|nr:hypothetical protein [Aurantiacibacter sp. D1-12]MDE1466798.1 hypothetical protein [Aurantiacibacter sp. D1-12]
MGYDEALAIYERVVADYPDLKVKGKANRYTSMNGNMFSFLDKNGELKLRFSEAEKKAYNETYGTGDVIQHNSVMRGYIGVTPAIMADEETLKKLFASCVAHAKTLKPKATKKT